MSVVSKIFIQACERNNVKYAVIDVAGLVISVAFDENSKHPRQHLVIANNLGLNVSSVDKMCQDKFFLYQLLKSVVSMPETIAWVDPQAPEPYTGYSQKKNRADIISEIIELQQKHQKIIVKPNSKSMGVNVFVCDSATDVRQAVERIYNLDSYQYDHVLIAQPYLEIKKEYRAIFYDGKLQFVYHKNNLRPESKFAGNLSPLHFENAKAELLTDVNLMQSITDFVSPVFDKFDLMYGGFDIAELEDGSFHLIEINGQPGFTYLVRDEGTLPLDNFFDILLQDLKAKYEKA